MNFKNKRLIFFVIASVAIIFAVYTTFISVSNNENRAEQASNFEEILNSKKYICPMHSHILSHEKGQCPICGMNLVINQSAIKEQHSNIEIDSNNDEYPAVKISPLVVHNLGIRTAIVKLGELNHRIETIGKITRVDPMARTRITSPINGKIIEMVDKYAGDEVSQDEFLFSVESEKLFELQESFQTAFLAGDKALSSSMIPELVAMGLDAEQVAKLQNGKTPTFPARIYAIEDGYIFTRRGKPGEIVTSSFTVFNLGGNYQVIEVTVEIFERQWELVQEGQNATMQLRNLPGEIFHGTVERVDEPVGYTTRALESRLKFKTNHKGMTQSTFARIIIEGKSKRNILVVPRDAVIRTGSQERVVKLLSNGQYMPVVVQIGEEADGKIEIISGLSAGDKVVISGQFLLDSESNLSTGLQRFSQFNDVAKEEMTDQKQHHGNIE